MENNKADMIEKEAGVYAERIAFRVPFDGTNIFYDDKVFEAAKRDYIAGRTVGIDSDWISVEILPDEHEKVLVHLDGGTILCGIMDSNNKWYVFYSDGRNEEHSDRRITHWMPLPEPPKTSKP